MDVFKRFSDFIHENKLIEDGDRIIVGVSGGADSLCLLFLLCRFLKSEAAPRFSLEAVHVNHGIRGDSADRDEEYTLKVCADAGIDCKNVRIDVPMEVKKTGESEEEAARRLRYEVFEKLAFANTCESGEKKEAVRPVLATGHHMDDQAETVLHNLFRGSAIKGLGGMAPVSVRGNLRVIRPLLCLGRFDTESYLNEIGISYCMDETNFLGEYTRNKIRHSLIPLTKEINARSVEHMAQSAAALRDVEDYLESETEEAYDKWVRKESDDLILSCECFEKEHRVICQRVIRVCIKKRCGYLKDIGAEQHILPVLRLGMSGDSGRELDLPYDLKVRKNYDDLIFSLKTSEIASSDDGDHMIRDGAMTAYKTDLRVFEREETGILPVFPNDSCIKWFDYDKINSHVQWRHRQPGDYIVTAAGRTLLKDFLIKQKIPQRLRDSFLLLTLEDGEVLWVMGEGISRINTRYMTDVNTKSILEARVIWLTE